MYPGSTEINKVSKAAIGRAPPAAISDTGCERTLNEDRYAIIDCPSGIAWVVCDGMGGVSGGELAAQIAIETIRRSLEQMPLTLAEEALEEAIKDANRKILLRRQNQAFAEMGTTIVAALFQGEELLLTHLGDSRGYLVRGGAIQQLTTDHTLVQTLVEKGQITPEESLSHPEAHVLTKCLGAENGITLEVKKLWVWESIEAKGDSVVLCTDGLYSLVDDTEIAAIVADKPPHEACLELVELAKARGGYDNVTVAIIPIDGELRSQPPPTFDSERNLEKLQRVASRQIPKAPQKWGRFIISILILTILAGIVAAMLALLMTSVG